MSFLTKLTKEGQKAKASLKKASTIVTDASGRRYNAATAKYEDNNGEAGYVVDTHPDPGLYECIPGLFIGSQDAAFNFKGMSVPKKKRQQKSCHSDNNDTEKDDDKDDFPGISNLGITHVVNLFSKDRPFEHLGIHYLNVVMMDLPEQNLSSCLDEILDYLHNVLDDDDNKSKVLVHCNAGVSRSSAIIIAYLIKYRPMSYMEALETVRRARPQANPNAGFQRQLKAFAQEMSTANGRN